MSDAPHRESLDFRRPRSRSPNRDKPSSTALKNRSRSPSRKRKHSRSRRRNKRKHSRSRSRGRKKRSRSRSRSRSRNRSRGRSRRRRSRCSRSSSPPDARRASSKKQISLNAVRQRGKTRADARLDIAKGPAITMEDDDAKMLNELNEVNPLSVVGPYAPLNVWKEDPRLPKEELLQMEISADYPIGLFLSLQKSLRKGVKQSYYRNKPMPAFYQNKTYVESHWGQRKLLMSEVMFLTFALDTPFDELIMVYAGAAHGGHILFLVKLFPNLYFDLYDPMPFNDKLVEYSKQKGSRVRIFTEKAGWFDQKVAESYQPGGVNDKYHKGRKLLFVSDIRDIKDEKSNPSSYETLKLSAKFMAKSQEEMKLQAEWTRAMKAELTMLKFKLQYPAEGGPAFEQYLRGDAYFQCWAPTPSSETRLLIHKSQLDKGDVFYNLPLYTGRVDYFNTAMRTTDFGGAFLKDIGILGSRKKPPPDFVLAKDPRYQNLEERSSSKATMADVWKGFGLKLVGMDAYIETLCWANYIRDMERKEVTVQNLRQKISDVSYILCKPSEHPYPERMFPRHLNYQKPRESADEYGKPIDPVLRQQLRERSKNAVPSATHWGGRVALELPQLNTI